MQAALALAPSAAVLVAVLLLRWSGLAAAVAATLTTLVIWLAGPFVAAASDQLERALADAALLTLLVAAMTIPGFLFVETARRKHAAAAFSHLITTIGLPPARAAILIAVGVGVMLESLTGMGVSLLVTVPLLLRIASRRQAIALALVGMSLMNWGALSISVHVGAKLANLSIAEIAKGMSELSGAVAFFLPLLCLVILGMGEKPRTDTRQQPLAGRLAPSALHPAHIVAACLIGAVLWIAIWMGSRWIGVEVVGVVGGLAVIITMVLMAESRAGLGKALTAPGLKPYLWLIAAVFVQKLAAAALAKAGISPTLSTGRIDFAILTSPAIALLTATLLSARSSVDGVAAKAVAQRAWRPVASIALFMIAARLLIESRAIAALAGLVEGLGYTSAVVATALLGGISGFATGSAVSGNALFMPAAAAIGESFGARLLFAALQAGSAGHVSMTALPVLAILLAALPDRTRSDDGTALSLGLILAAWHVTVLIAAALLLG